MKTIEDVAKVLLQNKISFNYSVSEGKGSIDVTDVQVVSDLFASATIHRTEKTVVLMKYDFSVCSHDEFLTYFK